LVKVKEKRLKRILCQVEETENGFAYKIAIWQSVGLKLLKKYKNNKTKMKLMPIIVFG
jgi:hypothetical protein